MCPNPECDGEMQLVVSEQLWVCQRACGFKSHLATSTEWSMFFGLMLQYRAIAASAKAFERVWPKTQLRAEMQRFIDAEDL